MNEESLENRLSRLEGRLQEKDAEDQKSSDAMVAFQERMTAIAEENNRRSESYDRTFVVGTRYFFQTSVYSYVGVVASETPGRVALEDSAIVKLMEPLFNSIDKIKYDSDNMLCPIKNLTLSKSYIASTFEWEERRPLAQVAPIEADAPAEYLKILDEHAEEILA